MAPAQSEPPNSLLGAVSGFRAGSGARAAVLQNPGAQEGEEQEVTLGKE